jgi:Fur family transcriptional regulator, ferric uptake regulator
MSERPSTPDIFSSRGLRRTPIREAVLSVLVGQGRPLSNAEVRQSVGERMDRVTLYRTLETLRGAGLVHQILGKDGIWRYGVHAPGFLDCPANHPHFLCLECGKMECLPAQTLPHVEVPSRYAVKGKQLVVYGCCGACGKSGSRRKGR